MREAEEKAHAEERMYFYANINDKDAITSLGRGSIVMLFRNITAEVARVIREGDSDILGCLMTGNFRFEKGSVDGSEK